MTCAITVPQRSRSRTIWLCKQVLACLAEGAEAVVDVGAHHHMVIHDNGVLRFVDILLMGSARAERPRKLGNTLSVLAPTQDGLLAICWQLGAGRGSGACLCWWA